MKDRVWNVIVWLWKKWSALLAFPLVVIWKIRKFQRTWSSILLMWLLVVFSTMELFGNQQWTILSPNQYTPKHYAFIVSVVLCVLLWFFLWNMHKNKTHKKLRSFVDILWTKWVVVLCLMILFLVGADPSMEVWKVMIPVVWTMSMVGVCMLLLKVYSHKRKNNAEKRKQLIDTFYGTENLLKKLWWSDVIFPIKCSGGQWRQSMTVHSLKTYTKKYLFGSQLVSWPSTWVGATTIVDSNWTVYQTYRITMQELGYTDPQVAKMEFEWISTTGEKHTFDDIKQSIIDEIARTPDSVYSSLEEKIQNTTSMDELDTILAQWKF